MAKRFRRPLPGAAGGGESKGGPAQSSSEGSTGAEGTRDDDERRRYYRITPEGTAAAKAEVRRLGQLVRMARAVGLAPNRI